jgi:thiol:disulfide interchange protein
MIAIRLTQKFLLALACLALVAVVPVSINAQNVIEKGAQGVKKGVETGAEKTKEGAEAVGKGVKDTFSSDESRQKTETQTQTPTEPRQKPAAPTTSESKSTTSKQKTEATKSTAGTEKGGKQMPATAGELPLLLFAGGLALAAAGTLKLARRTN